MTEVATSSLKHAHDPRSAWDDFVAANPHVHHAQSKAWAMAQGDDPSDHFVVTRTSKDAPHSELTIAGGVLVQIRKARGLRIGYVDRGPVFCSDAYREPIIDELLKGVRERGLHMLIVQPADDDFATLEALRSRGFGPTHIKSSLGATVKLDLSHGDPDRLLAEMRPKTRRGIRKGLRSPLEFRVTSNASDVDAFHEMLASTADRQGFSAPSRSFLHRVIDQLNPLGWAHIMLVEHQGQPVSGMLAVTVGDTFIYKRAAWSGSVSEYRPNEFMHWNAFNWAIERGFQHYDFDGLELATAHSVLETAGASKQEPTPVDRFKLGFGGSPVVLPEVLTYVPNPAARLAYQRVFPVVAQNKSVKRAVKKMRQR